jgi:DNA-binding PadR family transcriptional regulator
MQRKTMDIKKSEVLQGTLDLMILKTLHALGPMHGFGVARRIEQGWITAQWGLSENKRKAKFYSITKRGQKQLEVETENWERISGVIGRVLRLEGER